MFSNNLDVFLAGAFALGFGGFGLILLLIYVNAQMLIIASRNWPSVEGRIESSRVVRRSTSSGSGHGTNSSYRPEIKYTYSVMGNNYEGKRIGFGVPIGSFESGAKQVVARYPHGTTRTVYYNPQNPAQAVLERKVVNNITALIVTIACLLIGIGSLVMLFYRFM